MLLCDHTEATATKAAARQLHHHHTRTKRPILRFSVATFLSFSVSQQRILGTGFVRHRMGDVPRELLAGGVANATASILLNWYEMNSHSRHLRDIQILKRVFERSTERRFIFLSNRII